MRALLACENGSATYSLEISEVGRVQSASDAARHQALHQKGNTEDVHASIAKDLNLGGHRPGVVGSQGTRDGGSKLGTRFADADPYLPLVSLSL